MAFFEGALSYSDIEKMSICKFVRLQNIAGEISKERDAEIKKVSRGK